MANFTFEFLPHLAGNVARKADFSLYEVKWNDHGRFGMFEFQINLPTPVGLKREYNNGKVNNWLIEDISFYDQTYKAPFHKNR